eukprot:1196171-Prymnesium_polylepis.1
MYACDIPDTHAWTRHSRVRAPRALIKVYVEHASAGLGRARVRIEKPSCVCVTGLRGSGREQGTRAGARKRRKRCVFTPRRKQFAFTPRVRIEKQRAPERRSAHDSRAAGNAHSRA